MQKAFLGVWSCSVYCPPTKNVYKNAMKIKKEFDYSNSYIKQNDTNGEN